MMGIHLCRTLGLSLVFIFLNIQSEIWGQTLEDKIDYILAQKYSSNSPGAVVLVSKNGKPVYQKAFGLSNLELNTPMAPNNVFQIGSITKQFTAISILMLAQDKKLGLDDTLDKFLSDYPNGNNITIHHLLTHTSGIRDFTKVKGLNDIAKEE